ncbi:MAG: hypothetical protein NTY03_14210 [Candidatus Bathyarchaeota archaeon]|nr:hypothetical protein [Candidatus Bathyarchaeota archaeon]
MNIKRVLDSLNLDQIKTELSKHYHSEGSGRKPYHPTQHAQSTTSQTPPTDTQRQEARPTPKERPQTSEGLRAPAPDSEPRPIHPLQT